MLSLLETVNIKDGQYRSNLYKGCNVLIVKKKDQKTGILTKGVVDRLLTKKRYHSRGIKVIFSDGTVGRVQKII